jgi:hypothetical protein
MDPYRGKSPLGPEGTQLKVTDAIAGECFDVYRGYARDPTSAKTIGHYARIVPAGFPVLTVMGLFTNKFGGPDRIDLWCRLKDDLTLDRAETEKHIDGFRETQDESYAGMRELQRKIDREIRKLGGQPKPHMP